MAYKSVAIVGTLVIRIRPQTYARLPRSSSTRVSDITVVVGLFQARREGKREQQRGGRIGSPRERLKLRLLVRSQWCVLVFDPYFPIFVKFRWFFAFWVGDYQVYRLD